MMDNWLTTEDAAKELGLKMGSVQTAIRLGNIRAKKVGRQWFLDRNSIEEYRQSHLGKVGRPGKENS